LCTPVYTSFRRSRVRVKREGAPFLCGRDEGMSIIVERPRSNRTVPTGDVGTPLVARLVIAIENDILEGRLRPRERLDEASLCGRFGVSRTPIREALRLLTAAGLIETRPRAGAMVASPTVGEVVDLFETVAELEAVAARLAVERINIAAEDKIRVAHDACREAAKGLDPDAYYRANGVFHRAIHDASANQVLVIEIERLDKRLSPYRRFITFRPGRTETAIREHEAIFDAILAHSASEASQAMRDHVRILGEDALALAHTLRIA
jgi:DNA-binding GntR family transcriptional regulator